MSFLEKVRKQREAMSKGTAGKASTTVNRWVNAASQVASETLDKASTLAANAVVATNLDLAVKGVDEWLDKKNEQYNKAHATK